MPRPFPFDAVLFDLDGTLLATDRYWLPAAQAGAERAFAELGLERALPSDADWLALIGLPLALGFELLFDDLTAEQRALVMERCVEEEHFALTAGKGAMLDGAREVLTELRARGVRVGVASNCSRAYLDAALNEVGLRAWVEEARCLQSPGCATKTDMVQDLLWTFDTRSACFVGDRATDAEAAHANALPHVHLADGFAPSDEHVESEAEVAGLGALLARLQGRARWIDGALARLGPGARRVAVHGPPGSGRTLWARDASRRALVAESVDAPPPAGAFDAVVRLEVPAELCERRLRARHLPLGETAELEAKLELLRAFEPGDAADLVLDASNPLGPG